MQACCHALKHLLASSMRYSQDGTARRGDDLDAWLSSYIEEAASDEKLKDAPLFLAAEARRRV